MNDLHPLGRMLLIVPHQDDEILLGGGLILRAARQGLPIYVCLVTNGDCGSPDQTVGHLRLRETLNSLEYLGLSPDHVTFLGYADTGMSEADSFLSRLWALPDAQRIVPSHGGRHTYALPGKPTWRRQRLGREASYCRQSLEDDLDSFLAELAPQTIFTTCTRDAHGDHSALCRFVQKAAAAMPDPPRIYQGLVHSLEGDSQWPLRNGLQPLTIPQGMEAFSPIRFPLPEGLWDAAFQEHPKLHALRCHVTAMKPDAVDFLSAFVKADELFFEEVSHA